MTDHDDRVSRRYRELGREQPPAALDDAVLASARRAVRPARSRWVGAVSIAAMLVLAWGITLRMQQEEPGVETAPPMKREPRVAQPAKPLPPQVSRPAREESAPPPPAFAPEAPARRDERPADVAPATGANAGAAPAPAIAPAQKSTSRVQAAPAKDERDVELERIATLREQGKDAEADDALARFRERHPGYTIPDALWSRVRPR